MLTKEFQIVNRLGLHARAAAQLVQCANRFASDVFVHKEDLRVNGKSIMGILMLAAPMGSAIQLEIEGADEVDAMASLGALIDDGFGED